MKKIIGLSFMLCLVLAASGAVEEGESVSAKWTPFRICFTEGSPAWPKKADVYGLNIGLPASYNYNSQQKIYGLDFGLIVTEAEVNGLQLGMTNWSKGSNGVQMAFANIVEDFGGVQFAFANEAKKSSVFQFGLFNFARKKTKGVQVGLLNFMTNGFLPIFPIINFGF